MAKDDSNKGLWQGVKFALLDRPGQPQADPSNEVSLDLRSSATNVQLWKELAKALEFAQ